jgi:flavodoxin
VKINDTARYSRRRIFGASALLLLGAALPVHAKDNAMKTLVAYFTRSGNTRVVAGAIHRAQASDIFEIKPAQPYPEDYEGTVERARVERDRGIEPALMQQVTEMGQYETIYLGFPIWGETAAPVIRSFLRAHDLRGRTIRPFITHGGYGLGNSLSVLASHAPRVRIEPVFSMEADQERRTLDRVRDWLSGPTNR